MLGKTVANPLQGAWKLFWVFFSENFADSNKSVTFVCISAGDIVQLSLGVACQVIGGHCGIFIATFASTVSESTS